MATPEDEIKDLREKNNELVQKVQYWKMTAAQRENEKLGLMKEINELRLKLSRIRSNGNVQALKLDTELQAASEKALAHLVRASGEIAKTIEITKEYMRDRQEADNNTPRWSSIGGTPTPKKTEKVHRVPPMMLGGQSIQPVVALSRTVLNTSNPRSTTRSSVQTGNITERAVPMHMLQDVYIPLTRIDADVPTNNMDIDSDSNDGDESAEELDERAENIEESQHMSDDEDYDASRRLDAVTEELEPGEEVTPPRKSSDNPLEGPSWLLETGRSASRRRALEPDSTTGLEDSPAGVVALDASVVEPPARRPTATFSPTVRRRRHSPPPSPHSPRPLNNRRNSSGRVLKVMVAKMSLEQSSPSPNRAPPLVAAPSPHGATVHGVIVSETSLTEDNGSGEPAPIVQPRPSQDSIERDSGVTVRDSRHSHSSDLFEERRRAMGWNSQDSRDSDSGSGGERGSEGRTRRNRKIVTYKEKSLNRSNQPGNSNNDVWKM